jgi:succinate-semialdehyde dehydrogenase/glutarate-semialdehyde dehydrogenase
LSELAANAPFIVFGDADIEMAIKGDIAPEIPQCRPDPRLRQRRHGAALRLRHIYRAARRDSRRDEGRRLVRARCGDRAVDRHEAVEKVEAHIADALKKGAKVVTGGKRAAQGDTFFEPAVVTDVMTDMVIAEEETLGPVAPL